MLYTLLLIQAPSLVSASWHFELTQEPLTHCRTCTCTYGMQADEQRPRSGSQDLLTIFTHLRSMAGMWLVSAPARRGWKSHGSAGPVVLLPLQSRLTSTVRFGLSMLPRSHVRMKSAHSLARLTAVTPALLLPQGDRELNNKNPNAIGSYAIGLCTSAGFLC